MRIVETRKGQPNGCPLFICASVYGSWRIVFADYSAHCYYGHDLYDAHPSAFHALE
ncbi:hypothetical protein NVP1253O_24 [Vibrio phage 1.253.O._10N.286.45.B12]|nr:hypothetical protein NVP1235O_24 [Vibrio phage 1.235.O._10N.261.52.B2]AUR98548.1 hypothetical protein NVP1253O_24 [Vibrio phage 1.253.O._10N.286.45.B12]